MVNNNKKSVDYREIGLNVEGQRLDNYLIKIMKGTPKSLIYKVIRGGQVRINSKRVKPHYKLVARDILRIPPISVENNVRKVTENIIRGINKLIVFENEDFLILDKPSGIAVHSGTKINYDIISTLKDNPAYKDVVPVNRLDKNTSGCMMLAKNYKSSSRLGKIMQLGDIKKSYIALLRGTPRKTEFIVNQPLIRLKNHTGKSVQLSDNGKVSVSEYYVREHFRNTTLVDVMLKTGRTHQIRVHAASINHHICGDTKYGDTSTNLLMRNLGLKRIFLHSNKLSFFYKKKYNFESPLPDDLSLVIDKLKNQI